MEDGDFLLLPVKECVAGAFECELPRRTLHKTPYEKIYEKCRANNLSCTPPDYWERIGEVVLLPSWWQYGHCDMATLGKIYAEVLRAKTVALYDRVGGEFREQSIQIIYGNKTETVHVENGIRYMLDVSRIMFSSGNVNERIRMSRVGMGEIVVDMFSGIGYFTLPVAKNAQRVYACEKNPVAYYYLIRNIELNELSNVVPLLGDNRSVCPRGIANRVIMGYFGTLQFFEYGLSLLTPKGGIIHYHDLEREGTPLISQLVRMAEKCGFAIHGYEKRTIKSYAPRVWHVVYDLHLLPEKD